MPPATKNGGPGTYAEGASGYNFNPGSGTYDGVIFAASYITFPDILGGLSNTFLIGEKYLDPDSYFNGADGGDNETMYVGFDNDINRCSGSPPMHDTPGTSNAIIWGSAHATGFNMAYCDGSVSFISYSITSTVEGNNIFQQAGSRNGLLPGVD